MAKKAVMQILPDNRARLADCVHRLSGAIRIVREQRIIFATATAERLEIDSGQNPK